MAAPGAGARLTLVTELTAAIGREIDRHDPRDAIPWPELPDVRSMVLHIGGIHRWVTAVIRSSGPAGRGGAADVPDAALREWYEEGRTALLGALAAAPPDAGCWVLGGAGGTVAFWHRRMVHENAAHLMDLRAAGGGPWTAAPELSSADHADGIDELFSVFLPRSRRGLRPLPGPLVLRADDCDASWRIDERWQVSSGSDPVDVGGAARVTATASDLALALQERADLRDRARFRIDGDPATVDALAASHVHPW